MRKAPEIDISKAFSFIIAADFKPMETGGIDSHIQEENRYAI